MSYEYKYYKYKLKVLGLYNNRYLQQGGDHKNSFHVFVLCPKESSRWKYWKKLPVTREYGYWGLGKRSLGIPNKQKYRFRHNALPKTKNVTMAIFEGFINILKKIIKYDLQYVLITEDDAIIDWKRFEKLCQPKNINKLPDTLIYIGGEKHFPLLKDLKKPLNIQFKKGLNKITDNYRITGSWGQFIKNKQIAKMILKNIEKEGRYLSVQYDFALSKMNIDKYCIYPPIVSIRTNKPSLNVWNNKSLESFNHY